MPAKINNSERHLELRRDDPRRSTNGRLHVAPEQADDLVSTLEEYYVIQECQEVIAFLQLNPLVVPKLLEAHEHLTDLWGRQARVSLELIQDPDDSNADGLLASIQTTEDVDTSFATLGRFKANWWAQASADVKGKLSFTVEWPDVV
jgi:hypothetical protein